jgi:hypothetical protein
MIEKDMRDRFNHLELRLERFDATLSQIEKCLSDGFAQMSARLEGMGNRLVDKAALGGRPVESNAASVHRRGPCSSGALPIATQGICDAWTNATKRHALNPRSAHAV